MPANTGVPSNETGVEGAASNRDHGTEPGGPELSPAEERFDRSRQTHGLWLAPLIAVSFGLLPLDLPGHQQVLGAVLLGVVTLWIAEPLPVPIRGMLGVAAARPLGVAPIANVLKPLGL